MQAHVFSANVSDVDASVFRSAMAELPGGVVAITCVDIDGTPQGATLSAVTSLSLHPPMLLACFDKGSRTLAALQDRQSAPFAVHILADGQEGAALKLASKDPEKFEEIEWVPGFGGTPEIKGAAVVAGCTVDRFFGVGDHVIVSGSIREIKQDAARTALLYFRSNILPLSQLKDAIP